MATPRKKRKSPYTADRSIPGAFEGETVTRRGLMTGGALAVGGLATMAFGLPALGFALGPMFSETEPHTWQDVGPADDFNGTTYVPKIIDLVAEVADSGKTTVYVRKYDRVIDGETTNEPYVAISNRCMHLGCPVRYIQAAQRFICPCHGGVYGPLGQVVLDRRLLAVGVPLRRPRARRRPARHRRLGDLDGHQVLGLDG